MWIIFKSYAWEFSFSVFFFSIFFHILFHVRDFFFHFNIRLLFALIDLSAQQLSTCLFFSVPLNFRIFKTTFAKIKLNMLEAKCDECLFHPNIFLQLRTNLLLKASDDVMAPAHQPLSREYCGLFWYFSEKADMFVLELFEKLKTVKLDDWKSTWETKGFIEMRKNFLIMREIIALGSRWNDNLIFNHQSLLSIKLVTSASGDNWLYHLNAIKQMLFRNHFTLTYLLISRRNLFRKDFKFSSARLTIDFTLVVAKSPFFLIRQCFALSFTQQ